MSACIVSLQQQARILKSPQYSDFAYEIYQGADFWECLAGRTAQGRVEV